MLEDVLSLGAKVLRESHPPTCQTPLRTMAGMVSVVALVPTPPVGTVPLVADPVHDPSVAGAMVMTSLPPAGTTVPLPCLRGGEKVKVVPYEQVTAPVAETGWPMSATPWP